MVIIGIDPGFERVGFGILKNESGAMTLLDYGCIKTSKKLPFPARLAEIEKDALSLLKKYRFDAVVFEELFFAKNVTTALKVAHARGVLMNVFQQAKISIHEINPGQIKLRLTGYGRADKVQMRRMVQTLLALTKPIKSDDAADAIACAIAYTMHGRQHQPKHSNSPAV